jgi:hypothetical protein
LSMQGVLRRLQSGNLLDFSLHMAAAIALIAAGVVMCFFGIRLVRVLAALAGLGCGFMLGVLAGSLFLPAGQALIAGLVLGVILGALLCWWYRGGVFLLSLLLTACVMYKLLRPTSLILLICCAVVGVLLAILAEFFTAPVMIFLTALWGGMSAGMALLTFRLFDGGILGYIPGILLTAFGIVVQFLLEFRHKTRQGVARAGQIRERESTENEVEQARYLVEHLDELEDFEDLDEEEELDFEEDLSRLREEVDHED